MELTIRLPQGPQRLGVTGAAERNLKIIRETLGVKLAARDDLLRIGGEGEAVDRAAQVIERLLEAARRRRPLSHAQLLEAVAQVSDERAVRPAWRPEEGAGSEGEGAEAEGSDASSRTPQRRREDVEGRASGGVGRGGEERPEPESLDVYLPGRRVAPMTESQRVYLEALREHDLTFCVGPAGTGKTYLAVAAAASMLKRGRIRKLVLVRPAVEAGEKLGFLPGTMQDKVNPYLRPLLDALHDMMDFDQIQRFMAVDLIEIIPLAFMRGRTLNDACVILDEAQNTTRSQMLMFLTRLGHGSKMIVTGDTSQIDLEDPRDSGLVDAVRRLRRTPGVATVVLTRADIVRHSLVQRIVEAYGEGDEGGRRQAVEVSEG